MLKLLEMIFLSHGWNCSRSFYRIIGRLLGERSQLKGTKVSFCAGNCWIISTVRIVSRESLREENDCDGLLGFEFVDAQFLSISQFVEKTEFRTKAMRAAKGPINVEKGKSKKPKTDESASAVMGDMFNPHVNQGRAYVRYVCTELLKHSTFKSDLVVGLACFEYSVLFTLPRSQAMDCYARLFQSFCVRGWLAKELKNVHMDEYLDFIDDLRFV